MGHPHDTNLTPPTPRPYRVRVRVAGVDSFVTVWGYELIEALHACMIHVAADVGSDHVTIMDVQPDFAEYVKLVRGEHVWSGDPT